MPGAKPEIYTQRNIVKYKGTITNKLTQTFIQMLGWSNFHYIP